MPQFAIEFEIDIAANETLASSLNGILLDKPTWEIITVHTVVINKSQLQPAKPVMIATVVISSPAADMPPIGKDFIETEKA